MSAKNIYHGAVVRALIEDGWTITHDPLILTYGGKDLFVDLGAERGTIAAEKGEERIAVEIQSFLNKSAVRDLQEAVGQYEVYRTILELMDPDRQLFLAVPQRVYNGLLSEMFGKTILERLRLCIVVFDEHEEQVLQWIK